MPDPAELIHGIPTRLIRPGERRSVSRSATRALDLLELFGHVRHSLRAVEIARSLKMPSSTADQLLKSMVEAAHLTFDATTKTYLPSPRLAQFGGWIANTYGADERLRRLVRSLQAAIGETVTLTTPHGLFMQIIDLAGVTSTDALAERGLRVSMFGTAIGAAYLSSLDEAEFGRLAYQARVADGDLASVRGQIDILQTTGIADGPSEDGKFWSIAALLDEATLPTPLVLGVAGPTARIADDLPKVRGLMLAAIEDWRRS